MLLLGLGLALLAVVEELLVGVVSGVGPVVGRLLQLAVVELGLHVELFEEAVHPVLSESIVVHRLALAHGLGLVIQTPHLIAGGGELFEI